MDIASVVVVAIVTVVAVLLYSRERRDKTEAQKRRNEAESQLVRTRAELENLQKSTQEKIDLAAMKAAEDSKRELLEEQRKSAQLKEEKLRIERDAAKSIEALNYSIKLKDEEIDRVKNDKAKLSVKLLGESLEQHCEIAFNKVRTNMFPRASFGKDNDASQGSEGDYIYRECDENGVELLSIMFEMKNEAEGSTNTKRNSDHFKKLDRDRKSKGCEYAVLVSLLEQGNDLYDAGIADVSYEYEKMFVIRPQFFIPFIGLLRNAALSSLKAKQELERKRREDLDLTNFEDKLDVLKGDAAKCYDAVCGKSGNATKAIESAVSKLEAAKKDIEAISKQSSKALERTNDFTVRKLTWGNPGMRAKIEEAKEGE